MISFQEPREKVSLLMSIQRACVFVFALVVFVLFFSGCGGDSSSGDENDNLNVNDNVNNNENNNIAPVCGNGVIEAEEECDDGNTEPGDGCSEQCEVEQGWECTGEPSVCNPICGDGLITGDQECDDGNTEPGDGCSEQCEVEQGWECTGEPSVCNPICGDEVPLLLDIDPPAVYGGMNTMLNLYVAAGSGGQGEDAGDVTAVYVIDEATDTRTDLTYHIDQDLPANVLQAEIPAFELNSGAYSVYIEGSVTGCFSSLEYRLDVNGELTVAVETVFPHFGWREENTTVEITALDPPGESMVQFQDIARVYLSSQDDLDGYAIPLFSVSYSSPVELAAVVPQGLEVGAYDLVVVNPDGTVGAAPEPFYVTDEAPPSIKDVTPSRFPRHVDHALTITGRHFRNDAVVSFECLPLLQDQLVIVESPQTDVDSEEKITALFPSTHEDIAGGGVCVVIVTQETGAGNHTIYSRDEYSSVSVVTPSGYLSSHDTGPSMTVERRRLSAASGRISNTVRYLYAIGGDDENPGEGGDPEVYGVIEAIALDRHGKFDVNGWRVLHHPIRVLHYDGFYEYIPVARTAAGTARIGRFIYLIGGYDGQEVVDNVLRAKVLDPSAAPVPSAPGISLSESDGLGKGVWSYRVSAVFPYDYITNPGGESLPGRPIVVSAPDLSAMEGGSAGIHVHLSWEEIDHAAAYRIYRTPGPGDSSGSETLLAEVQTNSFIDVGDPTYFDPDEPICEPGLHDLCPRSLGELGEWAVVALLPDGDFFEAGRKSPGVEVIVDSDDPDLHYIYVGGGLDGSYEARSTISIIPVWSINEHIQLVGVPFKSFNELSEPRWGLQGFSAGGWVYFGSGSLDYADLDMTRAMETGRPISSGECERLLTACVNGDGSSCFTNYLVCLDDCETQEEEEDVNDCKDSCYDDELNACNDLFPPGELFCGFEIDPSSSPLPCLLDNLNSAWNVHYGGGSTDSYLYMFGGTTLAGNNSANISMSEVQISRMLGYWSISAEQFSEPLRYMGVVRESGIFYVIGGEVQVGGIRHAAGSAHSKM